MCESPRPRVLVVDDEPLVGRSLARLLHGVLDVEVAISAAECLARVRQGEQFDAILCDLEMPDLSGVELRRTLARLDPELGARVGLMTGWAHEPRLEDPLDPIPHIEKPFTLPECLALLRGLIGQGPAVPEVAQSA